MGKMKEKQGWFSLQGDKERKTDLDGKFSQTQRGRGTKKSQALAHLGRCMWRAAEGFGRPNLACCTGPNKKW